MMKVLSSYDAFYNMVLVTTLLSNVADEKFDKDATEIIKLIAKAYEYDEKTTAECIKLITDDLVAISTKADVVAYTQSREYNTVNDEINNLYSVKCDVISIINSIDCQDLADFNKKWFDYRIYKPYCPEIRFSQLTKTASSGDIITNKAVAIMCYLGIGTKKNVASSILRLKQCALWGDMFSVNMLKYILGAEKDPQYEVYRDLVKLEPYFNEGRTLIPSSDKNEYNEIAKQLFVCIASIKQDIVLLGKVKNIDFSFVEVILLDSIDYYEKLYYINNYHKQEWKEETNSSEDPSRIMGFRPKERK